MSYIPFPKDNFNAFQRDRKLPARDNPCRCREIQGSRIIAVDSAGHVRKFDVKDWYFVRVTDDKAGEKS